MFPNLNAEQARHEHTNGYIADLLNLSIQLYERKKNNGKFTVCECRFLCELYQVDFAYLFELTNVRSTLLKEERMNYNEKNIK